MWIILKILISCVTFLFKISNTWENRFLSPDGELKGLPYFNRKSKNKSGVTTEVKIGFDFNSKCLFKITNENALDRFFKHLGFTAEIQSGDTTFDQTYYIACDDESFRHAIRNSAQTRLAIARVMSSGCKSILCSGKYVWVTYGSSIQNEDSVVSDCIDLFKELISIEKAAYNKTSDQFWLKVLIVESFIWSIGIYSFLGFFEFIFFSRGHFFKPREADCPWPAFWRYTRCRISFCRLRLLKKFFACAPNLYRERTCFGNFTSNWWN